MTSYMTCAPTVFVVIMIRGINSKDELGINANIIAIHNNHDATQQLKHLSIRRPYNVSRPLAMPQQQQQNSSVILEE